MIEARFITIPIMVKLVKLEGNAAVFRILFLAANFFLRKTCWTVRIFFCSYLSDCGVPTLFDMRIFHFNI